MYSPPKYDANYLTDAFTSPLNTRLCAHSTLECWRPDLATSVFQPPLSVPSLTSYALKLARHVVLSRLTSFVVVPDERPQFICKPSRSILEAVTS